MKASELRAGNWIERSGKQYQISPLGIFCCGNEHTPILLTEEWLVKFGFTKRSNFGVYDNIWDLKGFMVSLGEYINIHVDWAYDGDSGYHSIRCYEELDVHVLQNLYFALMGEDLTFK